MDIKPMPADPIKLTLFEIFAGRAAAELRRLRAEKAVRAREAQLAGLVNSAMDAIVQLDGGVRITQMNAAAERTFEQPSEHAQGTPLSTLVAAEDAVKLEALCRSLGERPAAERSAWVPGGFTGRTAGGSTFRAEATVSLFELDGRQHFTLILRNVDERLEAERRILTLSDEAESSAPSCARWAVPGRSSAAARAAPRPHRGAPGRSGGHHGAHPGRDRDRQGARSPAPSTRPAAAAASRW